MIRLILRDLLQKVLMPIGAGLLLGVIFFVFFYIVGLPGLLYINHIPHTGAPITIDQIDRVVGLGLGQILVISIPILLVYGIVKLVKGAKEYFHNLRREYERSKK